MRDVEVPGGGRPVFAAAVVTVPGGLARACAQEWQRLALPGTWWTGEERGAIARELRAARTCGLCVERKQALSPEMVDGHHAAGGVLPQEVVDAVHRIASDPGRLTRRWFERVLAAGVTVEQFVELVGVAMTFTVVETLARALGCPPPALPEPAPGAPRKQRPDGAVEHPAAWVRMIPPDRWTGALGRQRARAIDPSVPSASWPLSLVPDEHESFFRLGEVTYRNPRWPLATSQRELVAVTVSAANDCFY